MRISRIFILGLGLPLVVTGRAALFRVTTAGDMRADTTMRWAAYAIIDGTTLPNGTVIAADDGASNIYVTGGDPTTMTIGSTGGAAPAVTLVNSGPAGVYLFLQRTWQGVGLVIGHQAAGPTRYQIDCFDAAGTYFGSVTVDSATGAPAFLGAIDPAGRIWAVGIHAAADDAMVLGDVTLQSARAADDPATLPTAGEAAFTIDPKATYLHQGLGLAVGETPATVVATEENPNAFDLLEWFPTLVAGDLLRFERQGYALNGGHLNVPVAVFTRTQEIGRGQDFQRLPTAIDAGRDVYTGPVAGGSFATGTNIPEDFAIGDSTYVAVPDGARYLMTSLSEPGAGQAPLGVRVSLVKRRAFDDWAAAQGMAGANAQPDSDLDGDGLTLIEEYAFRKDPTVADAAAVNDFAFRPRVDDRGLADGVLGLVFGGRADGTVRYRAEFSSDLKSWTPAADDAVVPTLTDGEGVRAVFRVFDPERGGGPRRFVRLRVEAAGGATQ